MGQTKNSRRRAYEKEWRIVAIKQGKFNNLFISEDYDVDEKKRYPVFLFTPDMSNTGVHYHIELTKPETNKLFEWLKSYLGE